MALIKCPECGGQVSDKAPACIHCGAPLVSQKNIVMFKTPQHNGALVRMPYKIYDGQNRLLGSGTQGQVIQFELDEPTRLRIQLDKPGIKDIFLDYTPNGTQKYQINWMNTFLKTYLEVYPVDVIDADR